MNLTTSQCEAFKKQPSINPLTGRHIQQGKVTYKKLVKACQGKVKSPKSSPRNNAPPMGPMIHWRYNIKIPDDEADNMIEFHNFIDDRIEEHSSKPLTLMELNDWLTILKYGVAIFKNDKEYRDAMIHLMEKLQAIAKKDKLIDDLPSYTIVSDLEIKASRTFIRGNVLRCFRLWESTMNTMKSSLMSKNIHAHEPRGHVANLIKQKDYLDYLIKHKIFSYDDIYKHTFKTDHPYQKLKDTFAEYSKLYKKIKGTSP